MPITDLLETSSSRYAKEADPTQILLVALGEIQSELRRLSVNVIVPELNFSSLEAAIRELRDGFPGPVPPQNLDLNPVFRSYEDTANAIKALLGEVKTTNQRIGAIRGGGGGSPDPKHIIDIKRRINDAESRLDYGARTDTNPIYLGRAEAGTPTTSPWSIQHFTYDASDRIIRTQFQIGPWDDRATLPWS